MILRWEDFRGLTKQALNTTTDVLLRKGQRETETHKGEEGNVTSEAEIRVILSETKDCHSLQKLEGTRILILAQ